MTQKIHLWMEEIIETDQTLTIQTNIEHPKKKSDHLSLWYRLPCKYRSDITTQADPFVVGTLFMAMRESADLVVHGQVSPSLLRNLEEFQSAWVLWLPEKYTKIDIIADSERESPQVEEEHTITAFSGGIDAAFTLWRHKMNRCGRLRRNIEASVIIHGVDIPLQAAETHKIALEGASKMAESLDTKLIPIAINIRTVLDELGHHPADYADYHAAVILSCMMILKKRYNVGLIGSGSPYNDLVLPWGSNPITDRLLSCDDFQIIHDGAAFHRREKVKQLANWSEAMKYLRVCHETSPKDRNCCCCEKCVRTILTFRVMGLGLPECFKQDVSDKQILNLRLRPSRVDYMAQIYEIAKANSISESWVKALRKCIIRNSREAKIIKKLKQLPVIRRFFYRSPILQYIYHRWQWNRRSH